MHGKQLTVFTSSSAVLQNVTYMQLFSNGKCMLGLQLMMTRIQNMNVSVKQAIKGTSHQMKSQYTFCMKVHHRTIEALRHCSL